MATRSSDLLKPRTETCEETYGQQKRRLLEAIKIKRHGQCDEAAGHFGTADFIAGIVLGAAVSGFLVGLIVSASWSLDAEDHGYLGHGRWMMRSAQQMIVHCHDRKDNTARVEFTDGRIRIFPNEYCVWSSE